MQQGQGQQQGRPASRDQQGQQGEGQQQGQPRDSKVSRARDSSKVSKGNRASKARASSGQARAEGQQGQGQQQGQARPAARPGPASARRPAAQGQGQQQKVRARASSRADQQQRRRPAGRPGRRLAGNRDLDRVAEGDADTDREAAAGRRRTGPITGEGFRQWSDRMRDVEELLEDPEWRAEAARIRDRVRGAREEFRRHAKEPDWNKLQDLVADPINELRQRVAEELRRRESPDSLGADRPRSRAAPVRRGRPPVLRTTGEWPMTLPTLVWGSPQWFAAAGALGGRRRAPAALELRAGPGPAGRVRLAAAMLKAVGFARPPALPGRAAAHRARSRSAGRTPSSSWPTTARACSSATARSTTTRGDWLRDRLDKEAEWKTRLEQDFDVRRYAFDSHLRAVDGFDTLAFDGVGSSLTTALGNRSRSGSAACRWPACWSSPTATGPTPATSTGRSSRRSIPWCRRRGASRGTSASAASRSARPTSSRPRSSSAPTSRPPASAGETIVAVVTDEAGKDVERQEARATGDDKPLSFRFQFRPEKKGHQLLPRPRLRAWRRSSAQKDSGGDPAAGEQTSANNSRLVVVDQGGGPYRVLYVGGRPNWEFKFLRRALDDDDQVQLVGLIRIAKKQPKFDFREQGAAPRPASSTTASTIADPDMAERSDQPVLVRLGTRDDDELRDGFPKSAEELYRYHAIVIDDLESAFFTPDQLAAAAELRQPARRGLPDARRRPTRSPRGSTTGRPVGDLLPVYLDRPTPAAGRCRVPPRPDPRGLAPALGPAAEDRGRGADSGWPRCRRSRR